MLSSVVDHLPLVKQSLASYARSVGSHVDDLECPSADRTLAPEVDG